ncbi:nitroreductase family protein [Rhizobium leguminosarum]|uniref:nitroreductase family protein n=1 Tax=Rhizobium ruizarguesonis TaxID=2081791 RepID=UPI00103BDD86|nr:nitroreductase family protein [Rhizobium ruizarguesonis]NEI05281.1 nitroreductase family protein [Rhizobium ruizarguesonis]TCA30106.1 nitroreductase family protein [Rhizobium leguminosarum bv. viciae]
MPHPTITLIESRFSANRFDPSHTLTGGEIAYLIGLATRAPTAYNLQNWRFIAVRTPEAKARLRDHAYGQIKVSDAAVTFIVCGQLPDSAVLAERLQPFVETGLMAPAIAAEWQEDVRDRYSNDPVSARDEAIRSATLGAATLIYAAEAMGLVSGPMAGFDADAVICDFGIAEDEVPVMLLPVGRPAPGNWPQKPRRPLTEVLQIS